MDTRNLVSRPWSPLYFHAPLVHQHTDLSTATSHLTGRTINRSTHTHQNTDDLIKKVKLPRLLGQTTPMRWSSSPHSVTCFINQIAPWHVFPFFGNI